tara:strand:- start:97 stop:312 length:216 start_codon:yes stop_codon:yes gene_type:complete
MTLPIVERSSPLRIPATIKNIPEMMKQVSPGQFKIKIFHYYLFLSAALCLESVDGIDYQPCPNKSKGDSMS